MLVLFLRLVFGQVCFQGQVGDLPLPLGGGRGSGLPAFSSWVSNSFIARAPFREMGSVFQVDAVGVDVDAAV